MAHLELNGLVSRPRFAEGHTGLAIFQSQPKYPNADPIRDVVHVKQHDFEIFADVADCSGYSPRCIKAFGRVQSWIDEMSAPP